MRMRIAKNELAAAVTYVARAVPSKTTEPIYRGMLVTVADGHATLSAFDPGTRMAATTKVAVQDAEDGQVLVPGIQLRDIADRLPVGDVQVEVDGGKVAIKAGRAQFKLPMMPVDEYPTTPATPAVVGTVPGAVLAAAVGSVAVAADSEHSSVPILSGVRVEAKAGTLLFAATDRYRCAVHEIEWETGEDFTEFAATIPARALSDIAKSVAKGGEVQVRYANGAFGLSTAHSSSTIGEIDGEYPNWRALFSKAATRNVTLDSGELSLALARVSLVKEDKAPVRIEVADAAVNVFAESTGADGADTVDAVLDGEPITFGINPQFLRDGLNGAGAGKVSLGLSAANAPAVLTSDAAPGFRYLTALMKMQD